MQHTQKTQSDSLSDSEKSHDKYLNLQQKQPSSKQRVTIQYGSNNKLMGNENDGKESE